eukprot:GILI01011996.1.p1 GENE.GILI01011996.1~~GILI01011996.1.p1  ORF type:complete len:397 (+),score=85.38 GILI01011996.1:65-1192(+)
MKKTGFAKFNDAPTSAPSASSLNVSQNKQENISALSQHNPLFCEHLLLRLVCLALIVLGPLITILGIFASRFQASGVAADRALIGLGMGVLASALVGAYGSLRKSDRALMLSFYMSLTISTFLFIFALGAILFHDNFSAWVEEHWNEMKADAQGMTKEEFQVHVTTEIETLGAFALTTNVVQVIGMVVTVRIFSWDHMLRHMLPVLNLVYAILGVTVCLTGLYAFQHHSLTQLPVWANMMITTLGALVISLAILGFYASIKRRYRSMLVHTILLSISSVLLLIAGVGCFVIGSQAEQQIAPRWHEISASLQQEGYFVSQREFVSYIRTNLYFAGLFGSVTFLFMTFGIAPAISELRRLQGENSPRAPPGNLASAV